MVYSDWIHWSFLKLLSALLCRVLVAGQPGPIIPCREPARATIRQDGFHSRPGLPPARKQPHASAKSVVYSPAPELRSFLQTYISDCKSCLRLKLALKTLA